MLNQGWVICGPRAKCDPRENWIWPATELSLPNSTSRQNETPWQTDTL